MWHMQVQIFPVPLMFNLTDSFWQPTITALYYLYFDDLCFNYHRTGGEENFFHCNKCGKLLIEYCLSKATNPFTFVNSVFILNVSLTKYLVNCHDLLLSVECCYSSSMKDSHHCIEKAMHHNCPVCFEVILVGKET
jgi:hypothetical protein